MHVCDEETCILQRENPESKERIIIEKYFEMHTSWSSDFIYKYYFFVSGENYYKYISISDGTCTRN